MNSYIANFVQTLKKKNSIFSHLDINGNVIKDEINPALRHFSSPYLRKAFKSRQN